MLSALSFSDACTHGLGVTVKDSVLSAVKMRY